jgi:uncharacterized membrane protein YgcG
MSTDYAIAGALQLATAAIWAGMGASALIARRRSLATRRQSRLTEEWQWLALAALQVILGVWFIGVPTAHPAVTWWLASGFGAVVVWMLITDVGPWLRSRLRSSSGRERS